ncbi:unnamed protein product [Vicia faba]|uniref:HAT C-terminal dimerisation domain-containing protein n=1 Tax=Vicia faba TaxID=3906 RepID=A0AAV0YPS9_VICFA|nr:unnamed protein product [Vicia faba]
MELLEYYYEKLYEQDSFEQVKIIQQLCYDLITDYQLKLNQENCGDSQMLESSRMANDGLDDYDAYLNGIKYPTLQVIAKDILAIPISTVASESAFSTSSHILSPHRSRLHWTTLEVLMCARSWLWSTENSGGMSSKLSNDYTT